MTSIVKEKLVELDLVDTYAGNIAEVKEFCLARSDYRETLNQRMQDLKSIKDQCQSLRTEYEKNLSSWILWANFQMILRKPLRVVLIC